MSCKSLVVFNALIAAGADVDAVTAAPHPIPGLNKLHKTLLLNDNDEDYEAWLEPLLAAGVKFDIHAMSLAARFGRIKAVKFGLARGYPVNEQNDDGWTVLHHAADGDVPDVSADDFTEITELLLAAGADKSIKNSEGLTAAGIIEDPRVPKRSTDPRFKGRLAPLR